MAETFKTEKEARERLEKLREDTLGYCPLIRTNCYKKCVCYNKGTIQEVIPGKRWDVHSPFCDNVLISGNIWISY